MDIARVTITLLDVEPPVRRVIEAPLGMTLADLHLTIQAAMGWENCHLYEFRDGRAIYGIPDPQWDDPDHRIKPAEKAVLADLLTAATKSIGYVYDMGDDWQHRLDLARLGPAEGGVAYPRLIEAQGRCPPEDVGGWPGFDNFLAAMEDPGHPEHAELREWYGRAFDPSDADEPAIRKRLGKIATRLRKKPTRTPKPS